MLTRFLLSTILLFNCRIALSVEMDPHGLLDKNDTKTLEAQLSTLQQQFENGKASEIKLRNAYRPFYKLTTEEATNLKNWAKDSPTSYVAHLAYGIYLKRTGVDARGEKYINQTPKENIERMDKYLGMANAELNYSLKLTKKPFLSIFHMMTITLEYGDAKQSLVLLKKANAIYPENALARYRYAMSLTPRWGGSYQVLNEFIAKTKLEHVPDTVIYGLQAIELDDIGFVYEENKDHISAMRYFDKAFDLGSQAGTTFIDDSLYATKYYVCKERPQERNCR